MKNTIRSHLAGLLLLAMLCAARSEAEVVILGTRVIYPATQKDVAVHLTNQGERPALVQLWIEEDGISATPASTKAPFLVSPPLARMESGKGQVVRVLHRPAPLPADKESLFWFNMLEVPPKPPAGSDQNLMQFAVKTQIKLIYRPAGLPGDPSDAPRRLRWSLAEDEAGEPRLQVHNPTPYYVNFASIGVQLDEGEVLQRPEGGGKVGPGAVASFTLPALAPSAAGSLRSNARAWTIRNSTVPALKVVFTALSDLGAPISLTQPIAR